MWKELQTAHFCSRGSTNHSECREKEQSPVILPELFYGKEDINPKLSGFQACFLDEM